MKYEISKSYAPNSTVDQQPEKKKTGLPKVIGVKPAKDSLTVKSIFLSKT